MTGNVERDHPVAASSAARRRALRAAVPAFATVAVAVALGGCQSDGAGAGAAREVPRNVRVMPVRPSTLTEYFELAGPMMPVRGADVSAEELGTLETIHADKGAAVPAGAPILELDRRVLQAELDAAAAKRQTEEYNHDKVRQLFEAGKVSRFELLQAEESWAAARASHRVAEVRYARALVKAPFAGIVADRFVEPGELVQPGMRVARIIDPYTLKLEGYATEREIAWLRVGAAALVQIEGVARPVAGEVRWVGFEASPASGKFPIEVHVANDELAYRSGVIGRALLAKEEHPDAITIPRDAVIVTKDGDRVFVVEDDRARVRLISLGASQGLMVAVTEGLRAGELLVVRGQRELVDGSLVRITERSEARDGGLPSDPEVVRADAARVRLRENSAEEVGR